MIRWLYQIIERPRIGQSRAESDMFLKGPKFLELPEQWFGSGEDTLRLGKRSHLVPSPMPVWLYALLVCGGLAPLAVLRLKKIYALAAVMCVLGGFLGFGLVGEALAVLTVCTLLYATCHALPTFAARQVLLLNYPHPPIDSSAPEKGQKTSRMLAGAKPPAGWLPGLWDVFAKEMSALPNALCLADEPTFREKLLKQDIKDDFYIAKERIIREILERLTQYYLQMWKKCTESQRWALFNLAQDGFLHARNPDIDALLKNGLIVADLNLRPMNESFRRFIIRTGLSERLDEDIAQAKTGMWSQVWRPIGLGLVLIMIFLVLTQEQYRTITLAFLGVLPGLLGAFSQALTSSKKGLNADWSG